MRSMRVALIGLLFIFGLTACLAAPPAGSPYQRAFERTNELRASAGAPDLFYDLRLEQMAEDWADEMCRTGWRHRDLYPVLFGPYGEWQSLRENITILTGTPTGFPMEDAVNGWWNSPIHKENILSDSQSVGFGYANCGNNRHMFVQNFGRY